MELTITIDIEDAVARVLPERLKQLTKEQTMTVDGVVYRGAVPRYQSADPLTEYLAEQLQGAVANLVPDMVRPQAEAEKISAEYQEAMAQFARTRAAQMAAVRRAPESAPEKKEG